jgi:hypothetical protein
MRLRDKDIQLSCMLIGTSFAFLVLCLPAEINDAFNDIGNEPSCLHWSRKVLLMLMQQIYYAGHFYIYTLTGQVFRQHLYAIMCTGACHEHCRVCRIGHRTVNEPIGRAAARPENRPMMILPDERQQIDGSSPRLDETPCS